MLSAIGSSNSRHAPEAEMSSRMAHSHRGGPNSGFHCTFTRSAQSSLSSSRLSALTTKLSADGDNNLVSFPDRHEIQTGGAPGVAGIPSLPDNMLPFTTARSARFMNQTGDPALPGNSQAWRIPGFNSHGYCSRVCGRKRRH